MQTQGRYRIPGHVVPLPIQTEWSCSANHPTFAMDAFHTTPVSLRWCGGKLQGSQLAGVRDLTLADRTHLGGLHGNYGSGLSLQGEAFRRAAWLSDFRGLSSPNRKARSSSVGMFARFSLCLIETMGGEADAFLRGGMAAFAAFVAADRLGKISRTGPQHEE